MISNIFFDLDGTLADPRESIIRSFQFALEHLGRPRIADSEILEFIGPPLRLSFAVDAAPDYICHNPPEIQTALTQPEMINR